MAAARFSSDGNANAIGLCYVLLVLRMTPSSRDGANGPESETMSMFRPVCQVEAPGAISAVFDCILFMFDTSILHIHVHLLILYVLQELIRR